MYAHNIKIKRHQRGSKIESSILVLQPPRSPLRKQPHLPFSSRDIIYILPEIFYTHACLFFIWISLSFLPFFQKIVCILHFIVYLRKLSFLLHVELLCLFWLLKRLVLSMGSKTQTTCVQIPILSLIISESLGKLTSMFFSFFIVVLQ